MTVNTQLVSLCVVGSILTAGCANDPFVGETGDVDASLTVFGMPSGSVAPNPAKARQDYTVSVSGMRRGETVVVHLTDASGTRDQQLTTDSKGEASYVTQSASAGIGTATVEGTRRAATVVLARFTFLVTAPAGCGDGSCNGTETCTSCAADCGACAPRAKLLYKTDFSPQQTTLSAPYIRSSTTAGQDWTGINAATGARESVLPWGASKSFMDMIADLPIDQSTIGDHITNQIQQVAGPSGGQVYALFQNLKMSNAAPPTFGSSQDSLMIYREAAETGAKEDTGDVYYTYWFKFQSDLHSQLGTTGDDCWRVMSEWKTGGLNDSWEGDYRIITHVLQDTSGRLYWETAGDNVANGIPTKKVYWVETNTTVPVPVGEWFKYEVFWHRSSGSDGRYWAAVNGQVIVDHRGSNMGIYNLPINRIMLTNAYSGGRAPIQQWVTGLEIWDGFPPR